MSRATLRASAAAVGRALRESEEFSLAWHGQGELYRLPVWLALAATALAGTLIYGLTMGIHAGPRVRVGCPNRRRGGRRFRGELARRR